MTAFRTRAVEAKTLSQAWLETVELVAAESGRKRFHTVTGIQKPLMEDLAIRTRCDDLLADLNQPPVETVANTIFPAALASAAQDPAVLVARYRSMYPVLRRFNGNRGGTYFGRLVAYPGAAGEVDQLVLLIEKLAKGSGSRSPMSARYEIDVATTGDLEMPESTAATVIHAAGKDNSPRGFPCLSGCSFHLDRHVVHLLAHYRYEYLIKRGYGNYLGLARLLNYVATSAGLAAGQMTIVTGRAHVDAPDKALRRRLYPTLFDGA